MKAQSRAQQGAAMLRIEQIQSTALYTQCFALAAMGIRPFLEAVMTDRVQAQGSFRKNLRSFEEKGYASTQQLELIRALLDVGHGSIHRGFVPIRDDIIQTLAITEHLFALIYVHPRKAQEFVARIPPRA